jgi:hypothetical protein
MKNGKHLFAIFSGIHPLALQTLVADVPNALNQISPANDEAAGGYAHACRLSVAPLPAVYAARISPTEDVVSAVSTTCKFVTELHF